MRKDWKTTAMVIFAGMIGFTACSNEEGTTPTGPEEGSYVLQGNITENRTLEAGKVYN